ncbi:hypothetical protein DEAC_c02410 [Desulfosporosinus acididurans]|uniref:Uncharacterized protein n=1 Tax=Desulfosporosinus acididurans TaxID=476652 RepID=A0A0J1FWQ7_9FIRM|nr:hypothetical protein [Desulfosporosinus acididurans]KLU67834.1 hypothetical protein DEAC_c02410 [Desulfosporosinus acididurans]
MTVYSVWRELIKPTIVAYVIVCAILAEIAGAYYLYVNYPIALDIMSSMRQQYTTQTHEISHMYNNDM